MMTRMGFCNLSTAIAWHFLLMIKITNSIQHCVYKIGSSYSVLFTIGVPQFKKIYTKF